MSEYIETVDTGTGKFIMPPGAIEFCPVLLLHKQDGALEDKPSFLLLMVRPGLKAVYGQFSLDTLTKSLSELGYILVPPPDKTDER